MAVIVGSRLGPYEIVAPLGAGGMGEVYRARDSRLGREVAIKVLPAHLTANAEVRARFEREARAISTLNHPNICVLHDVGREGETDYLVLELVTGETLASRLAKGPLPVGEALKVGEQIADALDRAHRAGVVHRDLKPGNIMLTKSGAKLMDFGLARALTGPQSGVGGGSASMGLTQSPTVAQPLTAEGSIVGTFQYMAPEQLEGHDVDARADLWALGCVLYEMVTARRAFTGASQASLISAIMKDEPAPASQVTPVSPQGLDRIIQALLAKSREDRLQTAHDARLQLRWLTEGGSQSGAHALPLRTRAAREWLAWSVGVLGLLAAITTLLVTRDRRAPVVRAIIPQPARALFLFFGDNAGPPAISPDGRSVAFVAVDDERGARLWLRDVDALAARPVPGTENATYPFWAPDSRSVAFFADQKLKRVDLSTGQVFAICAALGGRGGAWNRRSEIVFSPDFQEDLWIVSASGGAPHATTKRDSSRHTTHRWPQFLPDGRHFLFLAGNHRNVSGPENAVWVGSTDGREQRQLLPTATEAQYADGYLLFVRDSVLMARPFDPRSLRFTGEAIPTADRVQFDPTTWKGNFSVSQAGLLAYQPVGGRQGSQIRLVDRSGRLLRAVGESGNHFAVRICPGERQVLYSSQVLPNGDLFAYDFDRELTRRLTLTEADDDQPVPSPDGRRIAYTSSARTQGRPRYEILSLPIEGTSAPRLLFRRSRDVWPLDWSRDGRYLLFATGNFSTIVADSVGVVELQDTSHVHWLAAPAGTINFARFSNDGRWVAYGTVGTADPQVYIEPAPGVTSLPAGETAGRIQVSSRGGGLPVWRADDRELYYARPDGMVVAVSVAPGTLQLGREVELFRANLRNLIEALDVSPDGQRFLVNVIASEGAAPIVLVSGWRQALRAR